MHIYILNIHYIIIYIYKYIYIYIYVYIFGNCGKLGKRGYQKFLVLSNFAYDFYLVSNIWDDF